MLRSRPCSQESIEYCPQPVVRKALSTFHHAQVERHAPQFAPVREIFIYRQHLGVCGEQCLRHCLEVIDEREVELRVAEMDIRVDENRPLKGTENVVPVCVSVQKGGVNRGTADCIETIPQPPGFLIGPWGAKPLLDLCYFPSSIHFGPVPQCSVGEHSIPRIRTPIPPAQRVRTCHLLLANLPANPLRQSCSNSSCPSQIWWWALSKTFKRAFGSN